VGRLLISVTILAALVVPTDCNANVNDVGETTACFTLVPDNETVCGLFDALSETERVAVRVPSALGEKVTLMVHFFAGANVNGQLLVCAKSLGSAPVIEMLTGVRLDEPAVRASRVQRALPKKSLSFTCQRARTCPWWHRLRPCPWSHSPSSGT
jgi:hypothetical protein